MLNANLLMTHDTLLTHDTLHQLIHDTQMYSTLVQLTLVTSLNRTPDPTPTSLTADTPLTQDPSTTLPQCADPSLQNPDFLPTRTPPARRCT